jgi:AcrR family transcriptional regulator
MLLIDAAQSLFASGGYEGTSTYSIAYAAGVSESALFRHFGSKANLLAEAVAQPFLDFLAVFTTAWEDREARRTNQSDEELVLAFVTKLHDSLKSRRGVVLALIGASQADDASDVISRVHRQLEDVFAKLQAIGDANAVHGVTPRTPPLELRGIVAMITSLVVLDDWFLPAQRPTRRRLIDEITNLVLYGIRGEVPAETTIAVVNR